MGSEHLYLFASFAKSRLLKDRCTVKINLNGENTDLSLPPPVFGESVASVAGQA